MSAKFNRRLILAGQSPHIASPLDKGGSRDRRARRPSTTAPAHGRTGALRQDTKGDNPDAS